MEITHGYVDSSERCTVGALKNVLAGMPDDFDVIGTAYTAARDGVEEMQDGMLDDPDEGLCKLELYTKGGSR